MKRAGAGSRGSRSALGHAGKTVERIGEGVLKPWRIKN